MVTRREHAIRGSFSFLAAAVLLYMSAENADACFRKNRPEAVVPCVLLASGAVWEAWKVGHRVEQILHLT